MIKAGLKNCCQKNFKKCLENEPKTFLSSEWSGCGMTAGGCGFRTQPNAFKILNVLSDSDSFERTQDGKTYLAG
jgi:hypothetical protein